MGVRVGRVVITAACLMWLAGCETTSQSSDPLQPQASGLPPDPQATGSVLGFPSPSTLLPSTSPQATPELLGVDPSDDLSTAKKYFRQGSYGNAERYFRKAVEGHPTDAESWVGLAASYDQLRRFDLADRAYARALNIAGQRPEILNNQGFSYMLRGDYARARATLLAAAALDPASPYIKNNLRLLQAAVRKRKGIN
jgi:tetratricopeptide (TPR) repeat protein